MEFISKKDSFSRGEVISRHLTLRNQMIKYRDDGGRCWCNSVVAEFDGAQEDQMTCLSKFNNIVGHVGENSTIGMDLHEYDNLWEMFMRVENCVELNLGKGNIWALEGLTTSNRRADGNWISRGVQLDKRSSNVLERLSKLGFVPLSASTVHAALEASTLEEGLVYIDMYSNPRNAGPSCGILGTLNNNQTIDMSPWEQDFSPDMEARSFRDDYTGFICAGHTAHSIEAGRTRRVACDVKIRSIGLDTVDALSELRNRSNIHSNEGEKWLVYCMGAYSYTGEKAVNGMLIYHRMISRFIVPPFSLHVSAKERVVVVSISSGTLLKLSSNGIWCDNTEMYHGERTVLSSKPRMDTMGKDQLRACFSGHFNLIPYVSFDRAPRPTLSSVQATQAVCLPWCPGTASVSPCYTFEPLNVTPMYKAILEESSHPENFADMMPGENVCVLYLNERYNYEDSVMVSQRYVDMGGFSTLAVCRYSLPQDEYVPPVGSALCSILSPWWKSKCPPYCKHVKPNLDATERKAVQYSVGRIPTGIVMSMNTVPGSGELSVRVRSFQQLQSGDKLSTGHGQKGVATIIPYADMPVAIDNRGNSTIPDIVFAMSSVVTRQTNGQLLESSSALSSLASSAPRRVVEANESFDIEEDFGVISGTDGSTYVTIHNDPKHRRENTRANMGYIRMFNQTQMTRERHFVSHKSVGPRTLRTPVRRTRGGGVAYGEMEIQASVAAGLVSCADEIVRRGDVVVCKVCTKCQRLGLLCTCTVQSDKVDLTLPYDTVVFDVVSAIVYNGSNKYTLAVDT